MSICQSGMKCNTPFGDVTVFIPQEHPILCLARILDWEKIAEMVLPDLKKTTKNGQWWRGRKLKLRIHLGVYLLQHIYNKTDRQMEYDLKDNAAVQLFCGRGIVDKWHAPDHTKIEAFRSRLSIETQQALANEIAADAAKLGFADPSIVDIDSTIQEANMSYPADSCLLKKIGMMCAQASSFLNSSVKEYIQNPICINAKRICSKAREYFFLPKNASKERKDSRLMVLLNTVCEEIKPVMAACAGLGKAAVKRMSWNHRDRIKQLLRLVPQYLRDVRHFLLEGEMVLTKALSLHLERVVCFTKGKPGKKYQFGRAFQFCRVKGNFFIVGKCDSSQMPDKTSLKPLVAEHSKFFDGAKIFSLATDKGYYSKKNEEFLASQNIAEVGIQRPGNIKRRHSIELSKEREEALVNRRSGIEPLIGHAKHGGQLGRSRMKSDKTIECSGYTSVLGFNMRQLIRHQKGKYKEKVA